MAITRIKNNQITDLTVNAASKLQDFSITSGKIANNLTYGSDFTITGNLTVNGTTTAVDTTNLSIEDALLLFASGQTGSPSVDVGFIGGRGDEDNVAFVFDEDQDKFVAAFTTSTDTDTEIVVTNFADMEVANFDAVDANISGNIDITGNMSISGNVDSLDVTGNITGGNLITTGATETGSLTASTTIDATGNIDGGNLNTAGTTQTGSLSANTTITATGNVSGGNLVTDGTVDAETLEANSSITAGTTITATGNVSGGNITTAGVVDATGNVSGANINATGIVDADGNINGDNINADTSVVAPNVEITSATVNEVFFTDANSQLRTDANLTFDTANLDLTGKLTVDNVIVDDNTITSPANVDVVVDSSGTGIFFVDRDTTLSGNLSVLGTTTTVNSTETTIEDPILQLGRGANNDPLTTSDGKDRGIAMYYFDAEEKVAFMGYDDPSDEWRFFVDATITDEEVTGNLGDINVGGITTTSIDSSGNISGGNLTTSGVVDATGNVIAGNLTTSGTMQTDSLSANTTITATGNVSGGNITTAGVVDATGNISGGNITTAGVVDATGNVSGGNLITSGALDAETVVANTSVTSPTVTSTADLDITSGANSNINLNPDGTGEVVLSDQAGDRMLFTTANSEISTTANAIFDGANLEIDGSMTVDNVRIDDEEIRSLGTELIFNRTNGDVDFIVSGNINPDVFVVDSGTDSIGIGSGNVVSGAVLTIDSSGSMVLPAGTTAERPAAPAEGMFRYNETESGIEFYDGTQWTTAGTEFTVIASDTFSGDGSTTTFTLSDESTTAGAIVSINGVVQLPTTAYAISGTTLTFTEAPESGDEIEVRRLTTTTTVTALSNGDSSSLLTAVDGDEQFDITGNLVPTANVTYDLGSDTLRWNDLYLAGNSIVLGDIVIKDGGSNTVAFFGSDGTTPATLDSNNVDTTTISDGNSSVSIAATDGNVEVDVAGSSVATVASTGLVVTGSIEATNGFVGLDATTIEDGNSSVSVVATNGNVEVDIAGSSVATVASTGLVVTGSIEATNGFVGLDATTIEDGNSSVSVVSSGGNIVANVGGSTVATFDSTGLTVDGDMTVTNLTVDELETTSDLTVTGNLTVQGDTTTVSVSEFEVSDPLISLGRGSNGAPLTSDDGLDRGLKLFYYDSSEKLAFVGYDNSTDQLVIASEATVANNVVTISDFGTTKLGNVVTTGTVDAGGAITLPSITKSGTDGVGNIGSSANSFDTVHAKATSAQYADLAEMYVSDATYEPGTVVAFGGTDEVTVSDAEGDARIAGVISTNPSYLMNSTAEGEHVAAVALTGRVPTRVTGNVRKGDMMVSNGDGTARAESSPSIGTVIGKALEDFEGNSGVIEVVVGRL